MLAFFLLAGLFVSACDKIIGPDEESAPRSTSKDTEREQMAA
jgi:hypothetical protein